MDQSSFECLRCISEKKTAFLAAAWKLSLLGEAAKGGRVVRRFCDSPPVGNTWLLFIAEFTMMRKCKPTRSPTAKQLIPTAAIDRLLRFLRVRGNAQTPFQLFPVQIAIESVTTRSSCFLSIVRTNQPRNATNPSTNQNKQILSLLLGS